RTAACHRANDGTLPSIECIKAPGRGGAGGRNGTSGIRRSHVRRRTSAQFAARVGTAEAGGGGGQGRPGSAEATAREATREGDRAAPAGLFALPRRGDGGFADDARPGGVRGAGAGARNRVDWARSVCLRGEGRL